MPTPIIGNKSVGSVETTTIEQVPIIDQAEVKKTKMGLLDKLMHAITSLKGRGTEGSSSVGPVDNNTEKKLGMLAQITKFGATVALSLRNGADSLRKALAKEQETKEPKNSLGKPEIQEKEPTTAKNTSKPLPSKPLPKPPTKMTTDQEKVQKLETKEQKESLEPEIQKQKPTTDKKTSKPLPITPKKKTTDQVEVLEKEIKQNEVKAENTLTSNIIKPQKSLPTTPLEKKNTTENSAILTNTSDASKKLNVIKSKFEDRKIDVDAEEKKMNAKQKCLRERQNLSIMLKKVPVNSDEFKTFTKQMEEVNEELKGLL